MKLQDVTTDDLQKFFNDKNHTGRANGKSGGLSNKTIINIRNMMNLALEQATLGTKRLITYNPIKAVKIRRSTTPEQRVLDIYESEKLYAKALQENTTISNAIITLLNTGMRRGELLALRQPCVNFNSNILSIRYSLKRINQPNVHQSKGHVLVSGNQSLANRTGIYLAPPKSETSKRDIHMGQRSAMAIKRQIQLQETFIKENGLCNKNFNPHGFIFTSETGNYIEPRQFEKLFKEFTKDVGLKDVNIHATRHTFATNAVANNPHDLASIQEILGHAQLETTLSYTHAFDERKISVMSNF